MMAAIRTKFKAARALLLSRVRLDRRGHYGGVSANRALQQLAMPAPQSGRLLEGAARDPAKKKAIWNRTTAALCGASLPTTLVKRA